MDARLPPYEIQEQRQENLGDRGFFVAPLDELVTWARSGSLDDVRPRVLCD